MKKLVYENRFIFIPIAVVAFLSLISFAVMLLWNNLLPTILHVTAITFWQAMGIFVLCKILIGFGPKGGRGWGGRGGAPWMRRKMEERFKSMTPEEKDNFKQKMRERGACGPWGRDERYPFNKDWDAFEKETAKPTE